MIYSKCRCLFWDPYKTLNAKWAPCRIFECQSWWYVENPLDFKRLKQTQYKILNWTLYRHKSSASCPRPLYPLIKNQRNLLSTSLHGIAGCLHSLKERIYPTFTLPGFEPRTVIPAAWSLYRLQCPTLRVTVEMSPVTRVRAGLWHVSQATSPTSVQLIWIWHTLRPATQTIYTVTPYPLVHLRLLMMGWM
jgi:hypothetical protein